MKILFFFLSVAVFAYAVSIDEQIRQLQHADPKTRYELMNAIKTQIASMNAADRAAAIKQLQKKMHSDAPGQMHLKQQRHHSAEQMMQMNQGQRNRQSQGGHGGASKPHTKPQNGSNR